MGIQVKWKNIQGHIKENINQKYIWINKSNIKEMKIMKKSSIGLIVNVFSCIKVLLRLPTNVRPIKGTQKSNIKPVTHKKL